MPCREQSSCIFWNASGNTGRIFSFTYRQTRSIGWVGLERPTTNDGVCPLSLASSSGSTTMSNWRPFAWWTVITRTRAPLGDSTRRLATTSMNWSARSVAEGSYA